eukprot:CAMPEP_0198283262 /NCGR_PEP_ID=MMETSP1449-20131203/2918_1 /TAXON_ID=420275 /ORGANISM="Attheya septentrionalis, Strain CCMP2084" /LENGTH=1715 /DNA_ID=CAMNT_0043979837 /DNA_START=297 /DNA_END=5444 /DNA_ORIENTATION=+
MDKAPAWPLREECVTIGVEAVYNARGAGKKALYHEKRRKQNELRVCKEREKTKKSKHTVDSVRRTFFKRKSRTTEIKKMQRQVQKSSALSYEAYSRICIGKVGHSGDSVSVSSEWTNATASTVPSIISMSGIKQRLKDMEEMAQKDLEQMKKREEIELEQLREKAQKEQDVQSLAGSAEVPLTLPVSSSNSSSSSDSVYTAKSDFDSEDSKSREPGQMVEEEPANGEPVVRSISDNDKEVMLNAVGSDSKAVETKISESHTIVKTSEAQAVSSGEVKQKEHASTVNETSSPGKISGFEFGECMTQMCTLGGILPMIFSGRKEEKYSFDDDNEDLIMVLPKRDEQRKLEEFAAEWNAQPALAPEGRESSSSVETNPVVESAVALNPTQILFALLQKPDSSYETIKSKIEALPEVVQIASQIDGRLPLHVACDRKFPKRLPEGRIPSSEDSNELTNSDIMHIVDLLIEDVTDRRELLKVVAWKYLEACGMPDKAGDLPIHLLVRRFLEWEDQWKLVINIGKMENASEAAKLTTLYQTMSQCISIVLYPIASTRTLCRAKGSEGVILPLHAATMYGCSYDTLRLMLEEYTEAASVPCDMSTLTTPVHADDSFILPLELLEELRSKQEFKSKNDSTVRSDAVVDRSQVNNDIVRRSDLLFAFYPNVLPYRREWSRLRRIETMIRSEATQPNVDGRAVRLSPAVTFIWVWLCTFVVPEGETDIYTENVKLIVEGLDVDALMKLIDVDLRNGKDLLKVATPPRADAIKASLQRATSKSNKNTSHAQNNSSGLPPLAGPSASNEMPVAVASAVVLAKRKTTENKTVPISPQTDLGRLCKAIFNVQEENIPTSFIILPYKLQKGPGGNVMLENAQDAGLAVKFAECLLQLTEADCIFHVLQKKFKSLQLQRQESEKDDLWYELEEEVENTKSVFLSLYTHSSSPNVGYMYLLDDCSGMPVIQATPDINYPYPIIVTNATVAVDRVLPLMRMGMTLMRGERAMAVLARVVAGAASVSISPLSWRKASQDILSFSYTSTQEGKNMLHTTQNELEILRDTLMEFSSAANSKKAPNSRNIEDGSEWALEISFLKIMFEKFDCRRTFAGLKPQKARNQTVVWTDPNGQEIFIPVANARSIKDVLVPKREVMDDDISILVDRYFTLNGTDHQDMSEISSQTSYFSSLGGDKASKTAQNPPTETFGAACVPKVIRTPCSSPRNDSTVDDKSDVESLMHSVSIATKSRDHSNRKRSNTRESKSISILMDRKGRGTGSKVVVSMSDPSVDTGLSYQKADQSVASSSVMPMSKFSFHGGSKDDDNETEQENDANSLDRALASSEDETQDGETASLEFSALEGMEYLNQRDDDLKTRNSNVNVTEDEKSTNKVGPQESDASTNQRKDSLISSSMSASEDKELNYGLLSMPTDEKIADDSISASASASASVASLKIVRQKKEVLREKEAQIRDLQRAISDNSSCSSSSSMQPEAGTLKDGLIGYLVASSEPSSAEQSNTITQTTERPEEGIEAASVSVLFRDLCIDAQSNAEDLQLIAKRNNVNESALQINIMSKIHELENNISKRELEIEKLKLNLEQRRLTGSYTLAKITTDIDLMKGLSDVELSSSSDFNSRAVSTEGSTSTDDDSSSGNFSAWLTNEEHVHAQSVSSTLTGSSNSNEKMQNLYSESSGGSGAIGNSHETYDGDDDKSHYFSINHQGSGKSTSTASTGVQSI